MPTHTTKHQTRTHRYELLSPSLLPGLSGGGGGGWRAELPLGRFERDRLDSHKALFLSRKRPLTLDFFYKIALRCSVPLRYVYRHLLAEDLILSRHREVFESANEVIQKPSAHRQPRENVR
jgi:hypothetical protein